MSEQVIGGPLTQRVWELLGEDVLARYPFWSKAADLENRVWLADQDIEFYIEEEYPDAVHDRRLMFKHMDRLRFQAVTHFNFVLKPRGWRRDRSQRDQLILVPPPGLGIHF